MNRIPTHDRFSKMKNALLIVCRAMHGERDRKTIDALLEVGECAGMMFDEKQRHYAYTGTGLISPQGESGELPTQTGREPVPVTPCSEEATQGDIPPGVADAPRVPLNGKDRTPPKKKRGNRP